MLMENYFSSLNIQQKREVTLPQVLFLFRHLIQFREVFVFVAHHDIGMPKKSVGKTHYKMRSEFTGKKYRAFGISVKLSL